MIRNFIRHSFWMGDWGKMPSLRNDFHSAGGYMLRNDFRYSTMNSRGTLSAQHKGWYLNPLAFVKRGLMAKISVACTNASLGHGQQAGLCIMQVGIPMCPAPHCRQRVLAKPPPYDHLRYGR